MKDVIIGRGEELLNKALVYRMEITNLIPHISTLEYYLTFNDGNRVENSMTAEESIKAQDTMRSRAMLLEQLPYFLNSSYFFILQIIKFQLSLIETKLNTISDSNLYNLTPSERAPIVFMTDSFLILLGERRMRLYLI